MSDLEYNYDSDDQVSKDHLNLVDAVRQLDKRPRFVKATYDNLELAIHSNDDDFKIDGITKGDKKSQNVLDAKSSKSINDILVKKKVLPKPLEKPVFNKIKRTVGFKQTKKELGRWTGIIARNRTAASVSFPLSQGSMKLEPSSEFTKRFRLRSELENLLDLESEKEPEIEDDKFGLTYQESLERRKEAAKLRAQQSYDAAKARRQNKIKSKKFHRLQKKEKIKKTLKEFEELQKNDPQEALKKLEELDRARAHERMTLRHKSTGQWAKNKQIRAKYDKESRQVLAQQLSISKELTQKVKNCDDSEQEEDYDDQPLKLVNGDKENPWISGVKTEPEIDDFISGYRKFWDEKNKKNTDEQESQNKTVSDDANKGTNFDKNSTKNLVYKLNPVEKVIEEYSSTKENGFHSSQEYQMDSRKTFPNKTVIENSRKEKKTKIKAGTSNWSVSPISEMIEQIGSDKKISKDIDELFDSVEDKIQEKINKKLSKVQKMLDNETKKEKKRNKRKKEDQSIDDVNKLGLKGQKVVRPIIDQANEESTSLGPDDESTKVEKAASITDLNKKNSLIKKTTEIDPTKFINMKPKHIGTLLPDEITVDGALDDSETEEDQHQIISEAFADDDVVDEFRKEKEDEIKKSQPEDIDLTLPGWGSWGGKNIKASNRKKRRFILKFPKEATRRDENKGDVVIIEEKCPKIKKHLVSELPFPFTSVQDYEASIRAPIGRDFVPEKTFSKFVQPAVKTKMGKIIEPMSEEVLAMKKSLQKRKRPAKKETGNKKKKNEIDKKSSIKNQKKNHKKAKTQN